VATEAVAREDLARVKRRLGRLVIVIVNSEELGDYQLRLAVVSKLLEARAMLNGE